jgi:beta-lactam-binding protein with PASTA domain/Ca2+-binding RTX toxin-like protein
VAVAVALLVSALAPSLRPTRVHAQAPVGAGFTLDAGDIRFILQQIKIAESHVAGNQLVGPGPNQLPEARLPFGLRTVDGTFNNLTPGRTTWGAADQVFPRLTTPNYGPAQNGTSYVQNSGTVVDAAPRIISNLIVDQSINNPAAIEVAAEHGEVPDDTGKLFIPNVAPDGGLSAPFNSMFTFFGQFFDHGLDLIPKGGSGTVFIPLQPDDPLFNPAPGAPNFMMVTRGTNRAGPDNIVGTADDLKGPVNLTTPFVDQNQTYTSHPAHQVFLREYVLQGGRPVATGRLIDGAIEGNIANWGEVKTQARTLLGINLTDADVVNVPLVATDPYGRFLRGPNGFPLLIMANNTMVEGNPAAPIPTTGAQRTAHAFLDDIAHNAVPTGLAPDVDLVPNPITVPRPAGTYDNELLDAHFVTGDGRGNENIALTAVHTVFHSEHNRLRENINQLINTPGFLTAAEVAEWQTVSPASGWDYGERLFQAARFVTEMEYQHLVFEEFARKVQPPIEPFVGDGISFDAESNPAISMEFSQAVYRFGHSMLTEHIRRVNPDGSENDMFLLDGFLNPLAFNDGGSFGQLTAAEAAGSIFAGGALEVANEIDEFVTDALRSNLLGLPLDLAAINLARGRSEGIQRLNEVRRQLFAKYPQRSEVAPYANWAEFSFGMRNEASLVNFIAAYGTHPSIQGATTLAAKRAAAELLAADPAFLFAPGATTGVESIDLWMGGLAEAQAPFGGLLGATFSLVFEVQLEALQNSDRFYYLERTDGLNLLVQLEGNSFAELVSRNTTAQGTGADLFSRPDLTFNLANLGTTGPILDDPTTPDDESTMTDLVRLPDGTIRYNGPLHVIFNGSAGNNRIFSSEGDDTLRGNDGNDWMQGGTGNDQHIGGAGDDIILDSFGDDVLKGGPGNDAISAGPGLDLLQGNDGSDWMVGADTDESFGGPGNDFIFAGDGENTAVGDEGNDWIEGGPHLDLLVGDLNNQFQNDPNGGHDVIIGNGGDDDYDSEGGDDIMVGDTFGTERFEGMLGFDWVTYRLDPRPVDADLLLTGLALPNINEIRDRYDLTEGLSGTRFNDILRGDDRLQADLEDGAFGQVANGHVLTAAGIGRITGLAALLPNPTDFRSGNILLGGAGSDIIEGRGGDDIIDGDRWLNVQLQVGNGPRRANNMAELSADVFAGLINPGNITIVREIVSTFVSLADIDTAVYSGARAEYIVTQNGNGSVTVDHQGGIDGVDTLWRIERLQFTDQVVTLAGVPNVTVPSVGNQTQAAATTTLTNASLLVGAITQANSGTVAAGSVISQSPAAGQSVPAGTSVSLVISLGAATRTVPSVVGQSQGTAFATLANLGLSVGTITNANSPTVPAGNVISQNPTAGTVVPAGSSVNLTVSLGPLTSTIPPVVSLTQAAAQTALTGAGLTLGTVTTASSSSIPSGSVISQSPIAGSVVAPGTAVSLVVSTGPAANGLVLWLQFEEGSGSTALDSSPSGRNGIISGATRVPGQVGNALSFDGVNDMVTVLDGTSSPLDLTTGMTLSAWVQPAALAGWETVIVKEHGTVGLAYALYARDGAVAGPAGYVRPSNSGVEQAVNTPVSLLIGPWSYITTTYDGATQRLYVNGVQVASRAQTGSLTVNNGAVRIGGNAIWPDEFFQGSIDEVRIYNRALTLAEIQADMNNTPAPTTVPVPDVVGQPQGTASAILTAAGLTTGTVTQQAHATVPAGSVISQNPAATTAVPLGSAVALVVSTGPGTVAVPTVVGLTQGAATTAITNAGLVVGTVTQQASAVTAGNVISSTPVAGTQVAPGSAVNLVVSTGPATVAVPNVVGQTQGAATTAITNAGLVVGTVTQANHATVPAGSVISSNPVAGTQVAPGSAVNLLVSLGPAIVQVAVPNVVGQTQGAATTAITNAGLVVGTVTQASHATVPAGSVISSTPVAGTLVAPGSAVNLVVSTGPAPNTLPTGLVAAFNFDTAGGSSGTTSVNSVNAAFNGAVSGAVQVAGQAGFGQAMQFDGVNDVITVTDVAASPLDLTTGMTLSAWVNPSTLGTLWRTIVIKERGTNALTYALYANDGPGTAQPAGYANIGGIDRRVGAAPALPVNTWTHVAVTRNGATMQLYVNGVLRATTTVPTTAMPTNDNPLRIGGNLVFANEFFAGMLDDVRVYNRALTAAEIAVDRDTRAQ